MGVVLFILLDVFSWFIFYQEKTFLFLWNILIWVFLCYSLLNNCTFWKLFFFYSWFFSCENYLYLFLLNFLLKNEMTVVLLVALLKRNNIIFQISMHMSIFFESFQDLQGRISFFDPSIKTSKLLFVIFFNLSLIQSYKFPLFLLYQHIHNNFVQLTKQLSKILA